MQEANSKQETVNSKQHIARQEANSKQKTKIVKSKQQTANNTLQCRKQITNKKSKRQMTNSKQQTRDSKQQTLHCNIRNKQQIYCQYPDHTVDFQFWSFEARFREASSGANGT